jgi:hypothetical protein
VRREIERAVQVFWARGTLTFLDSCVSNGRILFYMDAQALQSRLPRQIGNIQDSLTDYVLGVQVV